MTKLFSASALAMFCLLAPFNAKAATLDFSGYSGVTATPVYIPETGGGIGATITSASTSIIVGASAAGQSDGFCFFGSGCQTDGELLFDAAVFGLTFDIDGADSGDSVNISAYLGAALLGSLNFTTDGVADFSIFGNLTRLVFDDSSSGAGVGYSTFSYQPASTSDVPEPSTWLLFGAGLALAGIRRRNRTKS